jgi:CBS domain-containing protein
VNPRERVVSNVMQTDIPSVKESDVLDIDQLLRLRWLRDMPVVDGGKLVGVVSIGDLLRACIVQLRNSGSGAREKFVGVRIGEVMVRDVVSIDRDVTLGEAAELMKFQEIAFLPMVGVEGQLIGVVTESDLVTATLR